MKKLAITIAIVFGMSMMSFADGNHQGGLFQRGATQEGYAMYNRDSNIPMLPSQHGLGDHQDADDSVPMGTGIAVLMGLGAAYLVGKKRKED